MQENIVPSKTDDKITKFFKDNDIYLNIGDIFLDRRNEYLLKITEIKTYNNSISIHCDISKDADGSEWTHYSSIDILSFKSMIKIDGSVMDFRKNAQDIIDGKISIDSLLPSLDTNSENETALISKNSKESLILLQNDLEIKRKNVEIIKAFVSYEMEVKRRELEKVKDRLNGVLDIFNKQITRIMRVISSIELYLGIDEEIFQIQDGNKAPIETPITFRQRVLYMDEEVANTQDGGIDFENIELFDQWICHNENYKIIMPEEKGIVVLNPRRYDKQYAENDRYAGEKNKLNKTTYIFIRNGECLYRIYTEKIDIRPRLFPKKKELMELITNLENITYNSDKKRAEEKLEDSTYQYKKRALLMQGLIDRTDILHPIPEKISIFKMDDTPNAFNFVYDDEEALPSGRLSFKEWAKVINSKIYNGSRIIISGEYSNYCGYSDRKYFTQERLFKYYSNEFNVPNLPSLGIYEVDLYKPKEEIWIEKSKVKDDELKDLKILRSTDTDYICEVVRQHLTILYNPKDVRYRGWSATEMTERKNNIRFKIYTSDDFVLNYDQISLDDINFYLNNRSDRPNYLKMMPLLREMKKIRLKEIEKEKAFATMIVSELKNKVSFENVIDCIEWWKFKNKIKRPIDRDDSKAYRMIIKKLSK